MSLSEPAQSPARKQKRKPPPREMLSMPRRILEAMEARDIEKPAQLAKAAGVGRDIVTQLLNGKRLPGVQAANVIRIAKGLQVDAGWLLTGSGTMDGPPPVISPGTPEFDALVAKVGDELRKRG